MRDMLEMLEDSAEMKLDEMTKGLPPGKFKCDCGQIADLGNSYPYSSNPFATPICDKCFDGLMKQSKNKKVLKGL